MSHADRETDPLKALMAEAFDAPPACDMRFTLDLMARIERRRLVDGLVNLTLVILSASAVLFAVMPVLTPILISLGQAATPAAAILTVLGVAAMAFIPLKPVLRAWGIRL